MIGFLIYLPTLAKVPHYAFVLAIVYSYFRFWKNWNSSGLYPDFERTRFDFSIIVLIVVLSGLNFIFGKGSQVFNESPPGFIMLPFTFLIALSLNRRDLYIFIVLALIEAASIFAEYALGISTFFSSLTRYTELGSSDLQYYNKPLGLSYNSSIAAAKMLLAFVVIDLIPVKKYQQYVLQVVFIAAIFLTFNRTVFVSVLTYVALNALKAILSKRFTIARWHLILFAGIAVLVGTAYVFIDNLDTIIGQVTRGSRSFEFSGREKIWRYFSRFIAENPLFGNNGEKLYFGRFHAHNSFIQLIATNGILISLVYFYLILRNISFNNIILILTIFSYSFFQFGIFWGISVMDIFFFFFLFQFRNKEISEGILIRSSS